MSDDPPPSFVDTNVLVYALASDDPIRAPVAQRLVQELMEARQFLTSTQVLQELFVTLTRKVRSPLTGRQALSYLDDIAAWPVFQPEYGSIRDAIGLSLSARLSFWDSLIVISASRSGAERLYSEELQDGQTILGVRVVNPFGAAAGHRRARGPARR